MRISGGTLRGRTITAPRGETTRPTSDFLRQVAFNILGERIRGVRLLDLYAGSGAFGLEALSRGADGATFVENNPRALAALRANLTALHLADRGQVVARSVEAAVRALAQAGERYDLVFLDPPYTEQAAAPTLEALASGVVLSENALVLVQAFHKSPLPERIGCLLQASRRKHGESCLSLYAREPVCP